MKKAFKKIFFLVIFFGSFLAWQNADAACSGSSPEWTAADCSDTEVAACVLAASDGDTINVPEGSATWDTQIIIPSNKAIWLKGAGSDRTIITVGIDYALRIGDGTGDNDGTRISDFGFYASTSTAVFIYIYGAINWRIDHNILDWTDYWNANSGNGMFVYIQGTGDSGGSVPYGLVDNNIIRDAKIVPVGRGASAPYLGYANLTWARPFAWGIDKNAETVYVEDNIIYKRSGNPIDANYGGEYVFRYNNVDDAANTLVHGVQGANRAGRYWEVYGNLYNRTSTTFYTQFRARAGTGVFFFNKVGGNQPSTNNFLLDLERVTDSKSYTGLCDGSSPWDGNQESNGYPCRDQIGRVNDNLLWQTFNVTSCANNGSGKVRITAVGHDLTASDNKVMVLQGIGCGTGFADTHNVLAIGTDWIDIDLDYSDPLSGTGIIAGHAPAQPLHPAYEWVNQNTPHGNLLHFALHNPASAEVDYLVADRDFYNYTTSFNGTTGVGCGTLASRPATCTTGVGYWATNQSCTDLTGMTGKDPATPISGVLYKCTATNTWTEYYTPYTYPHPLRTEVADIVSPAAPSGLTVS